MVLNATDKSAIVHKHQRAPNDTGSPEVQIALATERIQGLGEHFKNNAHDHHSRRGLLQMVNRRRKLLNYLKKTNGERYRQLISKLGLRK